MTERVLEQTNLAEFYARAAATADRLELIEGETVVMPSPSVKHQQIVLLIAIFLQAMQRGQTLIAPLDVELDAQNVAQPDVIWLSAETKATMTEQRVIGAPELVVEVLSPSTRDADKRRKFRVYERCGVGEYWLVDPEAEHVEVFAREGERFGHRGVFGRGESFASLALSATVAVDGLLPVRVEG
jgi:Uma2 family endonuclease